VTLAADNLALTRGGRCVVEGLTAALGPGRITAITGPNGAGKSSLLLGLAGLLAPSSGAVTIEGRALAAMAARERAKAIGYLPQTPDIAWDVAVENLVALGRLPWRDRGTEAVEAALAALDLAHLRHRPASRLSGGERARALLARVLAGEPEFLLADEPLANLDPRHQFESLALLRKVADSGTGVVLVLHDLAHARRVADRVVLMDGGRIVADDAPAAVLTPERIAEVYGVASHPLKLADGSPALVLSGPC